MTAPEDMPIETPVTANARPVRFRAARRAPSAEPVLLRFVDGDPVTFNASERALLLDCLQPGTQFEPEEVIKQLEQLASSFGGWRSRPRSSREIARIELEELADLAAHPDSMGHDRVSRLQQLISDPDDLAQTLLWKGLRADAQWDQKVSPPEWLNSNAVDWPTVSRAAAEAANSMKGGDYANLDLHFAVQALCDIFEEFTDKKATMNRASRRPSKICALARVFFDMFDPDLSVRTIDNAVDQAIRSRRKVAKLKVNAVAPILPT